MGLSVKAAADRASEPALDRNCFPATPQGNDTWLSSASPQALRYRMKTFAVLAIYRSAATIRFNELEHVGAARCLPWSVFPMLGRVSRGNRHVADGRPEQARGNL